MLKNVGAYFLGKITDIDKYWQILAKVFKNSENRKNTNTKERYTHQRFQGKVFVLAGINTF